MYLRAGTVSSLYSIILVFIALISASSLRTYSSHQHSLHFLIFGVSAVEWISQQFLHILRVASLLYTSSSGISS
jgi:hypothetical protein